MIIVCHDTLKMAVMKHTALVKARYVFSYLAGIKGIFFKVIRRGRLRPFLQERLGF